MEKGWRKSYTARFNIYGILAPLLTLPQSRSCLCTPTTTLRIDINPNYDSMAYLKRRLFELIPSGAAWLQNFGLAAKFASCVYPWPTTVWMKCDLNEDFRSTLLKKKISWNATLGGIFRLFKSLTISSYLSNYIFEFIRFVRTCDEKLLNKTVLYFVLTHARTSIYL